MAVEEYYYLIFPSNNGRLIEEALTKRPYWKNICPEEVDFYSLYNEYCNKRNITTNSQEKESLSQKMKATKKELYKTLDQYFLKQEFDFCWNSTLEVFGCIPHTKVNMHNVPSKSPKPKSGHTQLVNHFPHIGCLTTKIGLIRSLRTFYLTKGYSLFGTTPNTYIITDASSISMTTGSTMEWKDFLTHYNKISNHKFDSDSDSSLYTLRPKYCEKNVWIVKPSGLNCGRGIQVFNDLRKIVNFIRCNHKGTEFVVQKYIERPLLYEGRKFDIRQWVVVSNDMDIYFYKEGYIRTSSEKFSLDLKDNSKMVHLTNYCMQIKSENLGKFEEGNTLSYKQLEDFINEKMIKNSNNNNNTDRLIDFNKDIIPRMKDIVIDTILSVNSKLNSGNSNRNCFELYGYDFMIDEDLRIWLIEINTNPFLGVQNPWHQNLLNEMSEDLCQLIIDPYYPCPEKYRGFLHYKVDNGYECIYSKNGTIPVEHKYSHIRDLEWYYPVGIPKDYYNNINNNDLTVDNTAKTTTTTTTTTTTITTTTTNKNNNTPLSSSPKENKSNDNSSTVSNKKTNIIGSPIKVKESSKTINRLASAKTDNNNNNNNNKKLDTTLEQKKLLNVLKYEEIKKFEIPHKNNNNNHYNYKYTKSKVYETKQPSATTPSPSNNNSKTPTIIRKPLLPTMVGLPETPPTNTNSKSKRITKKSSSARSNSAPIKEESASTSLELKKKELKDSNNNGIYSPIMKESSKKKRVVIVNNNNNVINNDECTIVIEHLIEELNKKGYHISKNEEGRIELVKGSLPSLLGKEKNIAIDNYMKLFLSELYNLCKDKKQIQNLLKNNTINLLWLILNPIHECIFSNKQIKYSIIRCLYTLLNNIYISNYHSIINLPKLSDVNEFIEKNFDIFIKIQDNNIINQVKNVMIYILIYHLRNIHIENSYSSNLLYFILPFLLYLLNIKDPIISVHDIRFVPNSLFLTLESVIINRSWNCSSIFKKNGNLSIIIQNECRKELERRDHSLIKKTFIHK